MVFMVTLFTEHKLIILFIKINRKYKLCKSDCFELTLYYLVLTLVLTK